MVRKSWDIAFVVYIQLLSTKDSNSQDTFCPEDNKDKTVNICSDHSRSRTREVFIDTVSVPKFQQTFCECIITPFQTETEFNIGFIEPIDNNAVQMKINGLVLQNTYDYFDTTLSRETTLYFSAAKNYAGGACVGVRAWNHNFFNITCSHPTTLVIEKTPSATSRTTITDNKATPLTKAKTTTKDLSGFLNVKTSTTETIQKGNITSVITDASVEGNINLAVFVPAAVIGGLLIAVVLFIFYLRRRKDPCMSSPEQDQGHQNNQDNEEGNLDIPVNAYERLNMYANDTMAGEIYQQLADKTEENLEMYDVGTDSRNKNRNVTKQVKQENQLKGQAKGQGINSNSEDRDTEFVANAYERLNMYANDKLAGEMYEKLNANQDVSGNKDIPVKIIYHGTNQKNQAFVVYAKPQ